MNLLDTSDKYRETADDFLKSSHLLSVLEKHGRIEFEGAYAGNVMLYGDIDIKVIRDTDYTQDEIFIILKDIHDTCGDSIRSLFIKADWDDPRFGKQYPHGKYIGLNIAETKMKFYENFTVNTVPFPTSLSTEMVPPYECTISATSAKPSPLLEVLKLRASSAL